MKYIAIIFLLMPTMALAQKQPQVPVPAEQRIATQIGNLIIQITAQSVQIEQLQASLAEAQARAKELEDKQAPNQ